VANLQIKGLKELQAKLGAVAAAEYLRAIVQAATLRLKSRAAVYPPSTAANLPGAYPKRWYERGFGARWAKKSGGVGGRRTSERLGTQWYALASALQGVVGNRASYARYPKGFVGKDPRQALAMRRLGWTSIEDDAAKEIPGIERDMQAAVDKQLR